MPPSPCVGVCALKGDYCYGCGRTGDEIAAWGTLSAKAQSAIWAKLPVRLAAFGFKTFRLAAGPAVVGDFIERSLGETTGVWRLVSASVEGRMAIHAKARPAVTQTGERIDAIAANGDRLSLTKHDKVRVFGFSSREGAQQMDTIALVLPKGRAQRDLKEASSFLPAGATEIPLPEPFAEAWQTQDGAGHVLRNALGSILTTSAAFADGEIHPDANAPPDVKISRAFVACAIFHADDPRWLAAALAP